jgi:hypothetical protein
MSTTSETGEKRQPCAAVRKDGTQCKGNATANSPYCFAHTPDANANRAKGGRATRKSERAARLLPVRMQPVSALLSTALQEVYDGKLEPKQASAMAALASALCRIYQVSEFEERIRHLEQIVNTTTERNAG